ncbi:UNVERIFIED_CONTAM: hypothetical protein Slati_1103700 [Sesamum latifolium]|uniref:Uncharacterized protein n=1 Tax=Sesamum latifolium TaxID=2727402 RepID=A0AAW2XGF2_9LAMI
MAGVRQFTGNSSTITPSVKAMPTCSSAVLPSLDIGHPAIPFGDTPIRLAIEGVHLLHGQEVVWRVFR